MRQQLISWLIEDVAPEIRRSKDASGSIVKFANERNLSAAQVQAMGQLYNTAKTLSFFEKAASRKGDNFPILDVDAMVSDFLAAGEKKASEIPTRLEYDDMDNGGGLSLPACFGGLTHNVLRVEQPAPAMVEVNEIKRAQAEKSQNALTIEFAQQARFDAQEDMRKAAAKIVRCLRRNTGYQFDELEADSLAIFGDDIKPVMDKLARYCQDDGWPVKRAAAPSQDKLVEDPDALIPLVEDIFDKIYVIKAAEEILQPAGDTSENKGVMTNAPIVEKKPELDIPLKSAASTKEVKKFDPAAKQKEREESQEKGDTRPWTAPKGPSQQTGSSGGAKQPPGKPGKPPTEGGQDFISRLKPGLPGELANWIGGGAQAGAGAIRSMLPQYGTQELFNRPNKEQETVDTRHRDAKHTAVLQNLMTTDEILAEADPEHVIGIYNTIREVSPELAGDINVMRVLLRSAVQHEGISPFDLKGIIETELAKQKVDINNAKIHDWKYRTGQKVPERSF